ncbi:flagellar brake protein [Noviherbaspirillum malthae]|uniref:flagellar brake protein n=1 Tax=Noviherbaspirillum malthae TaxID=1260987 RepID=UPI00189029B0|nr:flagellar brake protein [Noviherbaspirillum malthae]
MFKEKYGIDDVGPYEITSARQITRMLASLCEARNDLKLQRLGMDATLTTRILDIDEARGVIELLPPLPAMSDRHIPNASGLWAESSVDGVHTFFQVASLALNILADGPVWEMPIPETIIRLQRREYYRVPAKAGRPIHCIVPAGGNDATPGQAVLVLNDISLGGASLVDRLGVMDPAVGTLYPNCRFDLPIGSSVVADLVVANAREKTLPDGQTVRTVGCRFDALPRPMAAAVQRFIVQLERDNLARDKRSA